MTSGLLVRERRLYNLTWSDLKNETTRYHVVREWANRFVYSTRVRWATFLMTSLLTCWSHTITTLLSTRGAAFTRTFTRVYRLVRLMMQTRKPSDSKHGSYRKLGERFVMSKKLRMDDDLPCISILTLLWTHQNYQKLKLLTLGKLLVYLFPF